MTQRSAARLAWGLWGFVVVVTLSGCVFWFLTRSVVKEIYGVRGFEVGIVLAATTLGALVAARRNVIGWLMIASGFFAGVGFFGAEYATYSFDQRAGTLPATSFLAWFQNWAWVPLVGFMGGYVFLLFPSGRLHTRRARAAAVLVGVAITAFASGFSLFPGQLQNVPDGVVNPVGISEETGDAILSLGGMLLLAAIATGVGSLIGRLRRSAGEEREQFKWVAAAGVVVGIAMLANIVVGVGGIGTTDVYDRSVAVFTVLALLTLVVAIGIAVLKYRLYDIDVVINHTIVFAALAAFITAVYVAIVVGIGATVGGGDEPNLGLSILATAIVAVAFQPLRDRASRLANRLVFGKRATPYEVLSGLAERIGETYSTAAVLPRLAELMTQATGARHAAVWICVGPEIRRAASSPPEENGGGAVSLAGDELPALPDSSRTYPVRHQGELLGALSVQAAGEDLTPAEDRLLADIAAHAGLVLGNVRLVAELQASRQRLVAAQDMERRRIERNLHDGAQQQLVALSVKLNILRQLVEQEPGQAQAMADQLRAEATDALENLRNLARGIYPPLLAERGLAAALTAQAEKAAVPVRVEADGLARYAMEVESAVYFCVLEAIQNAAKYARSSRVRVRLSGDNGSLEFEVDDDGAGFDPRATTRGAGLTNMTDRVEALGGRLDVESRPGAGTRVRGLIPARAARTS